MAPCYAAAMMALVFIIVLGFGPPFYWGFTGKPVLGPLIWSVGMGIYAVATGWRAQKCGVLSSALIGICVAAALCLAIYFLGRRLSVPIYS